MLKKIQEIELNNKTVIVRFDYNVPIQNNLILDDSKIIASYKTINYLLSNNCKIIILSHLGKVKTIEDKTKNSLKIVYNYLKEKYNIFFSEYTHGKELEKIVSNLNYKEILLIENTRFEDLENEKESNNNLELAKYWSNFGDIYINDAFGSLHRNHASTAGIARFLPHGLGFLVQSELNNLNILLDNPQSPFVIVMGGAKINDKLELINKLLPIADKMIIAGGLANTFLKATNKKIGSSIVNEEMVPIIKKIYSKYSDKILLPIDVITEKNNNPVEREITEIENNEIIYDIGKKTIKLFSQELKKAHTIFINGTIGLYENKLYANGTKEILETIANNDNIAIAGGGDGVAAIKHFELENGFHYLSTGGGATLEYLINQKLSAIEYMEEIK